MQLTRNKIIVTSLLLVILLQHCESWRYSQLTIVEDTIKNFFHQEEQLWSDINSSTSAQATNATLIKLFNYFDRHLGQLSIESIGKIDAVQSINEQLADHVTEIKRKQNSITRWLLDKNFQEFYQNCDDIISTIPNQISHIFDITKSPPFLTYIRENSDLCQTNKRYVAPGVEDLQLQNVVMDFYATVAESLVKGYMTSQMAHMVLGIKGSAKKQQHTKSLELRHSFTSHYRTLETNVRSIIQNFTGEIWNCDDFSKEYSYTEITNFIQGYIDNEVNFNREDTCTRECSDYQHVEFHACRNDTLCILNYLDKNKTRCDGQIRSCQFIEGDMHLCPNVINGENDQSPNRRYNFIRYTSGYTLGKWQFCPYQKKIGSWIRWFVSCDYCFCYCDHDGPLSDRYFSLRESVSNIAHNKVVTGIRFLKKARIIHIFISERRLLADGQIEVSDSGDTTWISDYNFVIEDTFIEDGKDYHKLTYNDRIIELDIIRAPKGEVVTGARFRVVNNRLRFEIRTTPFNRQTGYLNPDPMRSVWRGNNYHDKEKIPIDGADVPIFAPEKSKRVRSPNKYVEFTPTDIHKDIAQTTVPFIDTQPVEAKIPKPLIGAGIYYKTTPGYGGFIGPLIILHDD